MTEPDTWERTLNYLERDWCLFVILDESNQITWPLPGSGPEPDIVEVMEKHRRTVW